MKDKVARFLGWTAIVISIVACLIAVLRWKEFEANTVTIVIAVLALVVTIYMIIHVWNEVTLKQEVKRSVVSEFDKKIDSVINHQMYLTFFFQGANNEALSQVEAALYFYIKSLECLSKTELDQDKYDEILMRTEGLLSKYPTLNVTEGEKKQYIETLTELDYKYRRRVEKALNINN